MSSLDASITWTAIASRAEALVTTALPRWRAGRSAPDSSVESCAGSATRSQARTISGIEAAAGAAHQLGGGARIRQRVGRVAPPGQGVKRVDDRR